jgi:Raf kinase inhibitor-like YbhB/YbcL family protein
MIQLTSPAFADGETIPERFTCDGDDVSPPLEWSGIPDAATELALLMEDPDAPGATFVHWVLFGLSPTTRGLGEGSVPPEAKNGLTSFGRPEYGGPCPPKGAPPHRYFFYLDALSDRLGLQEGSSAEDVRSAIKGLTVAEGMLTGTYGRS